jgi:hypothetical protein
MEVFNLERKREYSGYPVYWLGEPTTKRVSIIFAPSQPQRHWIV